MQRRPQHREIGASTLAQAEFSQLSNLLIQMGKVSQDPLFIQCVYLQWRMVRMLQRAKAKRKCCPPYWGRVILRQREVQAEVLVTLPGLSGHGAVKPCPGLTFRAWFIPARNNSDTIYTKIVACNQSQISTVPWQLNLKAFGTPRAGKIP